MMKTGKKWLALLLGVVMMLSMALTVQAAEQTLSTTPTETFAVDDSNVVTSTGKVTIQNIPAGKAVNFAAYQIVYATYDAGKNAFEWHLSNWAMTALDALTQEDGTTKLYADEAAMLEAIVGVTTIGSAPAAAPTGETATEQTELLNALSKAHPADAYATWQNTAVETGTTSADKVLPIGSYLIIPTCNGMSFVNMMASINVSAAGTDNKWAITGDELTLKGEATTITKTVAETADGASTGAVAAQIGDTLYYTLVMDVPVFPVGSEKTTFKVTDTATNLKIDLSSVKVYKGDESSWTEITNPTDNTALNYDATVTEAAGEAKYTLTVDFKNYFEQFYDSTANSYTEKVKITYSAELLSSAATGNGNTNEATLTYSNDPGSDAGSESESKDTSETNVYTYSIDLTKLGEKSAVSDAPKLPAAEFTVYPLVSDGNGGTTRGSALKFVTVTVDGKTQYRVADSDDTNTVGYVTTDAGGNLVLTGLDADKGYEIEETKAPAGYSLNTETLTFKIGAKNDAQSVVTQAIEALKAADGTALSLDNSGWTVEATSYESGTAVMTLTDTKLSALPSTGGMGTLIFTVVGVSCMCLAVLMFAAKRRKRNEA